MCATYSLREPGASQSERYFRISFREFCCSCLRPQTIMGGDSTTPDVRLYSNFKFEQGVSPRCIHLSICSA